MKLITLIFVITFFNIASANKFPDELNGVWSIQSSVKTHRWVVIHNIETRDGQKIYHIEVLSRKRSDPAWQVIHLSPHIAITEIALIKSIIKQKQNGAVYPETYNDAYSKWRSDNNNTGGVICTSSIEQCINNSSRR
jgi:hypothetical protein